jgi:cell division transport system permease protein
MDKMAQDIAVIDKDIVIDTHQAWLQSLLRMISSLRFAALVVVMIIAGTTITAIAGAIRSRIAVHRADVELLHLMGANDEYIVRQFQRHALSIALQGSAIGTITAVVIMYAARHFTGIDAQSMLPAFTLQAGQSIAVASLPFIACVIAALTARFTVLRSLALMP